MPRAAAIYARISADPRGDELGVKRQVQDCRALANRRDWPVADIYVDDDKSAWSGKPRPEYRRLLDDIADGAIDAIVDPPPSAASGYRRKPQNPSWRLTSFVPYSSEERGE